MNSVSRQKWKENIQEVDQPNLKQTTEQVMKHKFSSKSFQRNVIFQLLERLQDYVSYLLLV